MVAGCVGEGPAGELGNFMREADLPDPADLLDGKRVKEGSHVFITTSNGVKSAARELGYLQKIEASGAIVLEGVCFYILQNLPQIRVREGWVNLVTNSAKLANIIGAHKFNTILRRTAACIDIAVTGEDRI